MLRAWVETGENRAACESQVILIKEKKEKFAAEREPWSIRDTLRAGWPLEKIRSIVARGGGEPDPDCPEIPSLNQFWVTVSSKRTDTQSAVQRAQTNIQVRTTGEGVAGLVGLQAAASGRAAAMAPDVIDQVKASLGEEGGMFKTHHDIEHMSF